MKDQAYIELTLELTRLKVQLEDALASLVEDREKYNKLIAQMAGVEEEIESHNTICPLGGM